MNIEPRLADARLPGAVGFGLRRPHLDAIASSDVVPAWLEVVPENYIGKEGWANARMRAIAERCPVIPHGVSLSIGGPDPIDRGWVKDLGTFARSLGAPFVSEHLCWSSFGGKHSHDLLPLPFSREAARHVVSRVSEVQDLLGCPLVLENITYYAEMPGSEMDEVDFIAEILERSGTSLLLDLNNLYINAINNQRDPLADLLRMPLSRVAYVHLAGHRRAHGVLLDDHGSSVPAAVVNLFSKLVSCIGPVPALLEWDNNVPSLPNLLAEVRSLQSVLDDASVKDVHWSRPQCLSNTTSVGHDSPTHVGQVA